jgi:hypothetical protein
MINILSGLGLGIVGAIIAEILFWIMVGLIGLRFKNRLPDVPREIKIGPPSRFP